MRYIYVINNIMGYYRYITNAGLLEYLTYDIYIYIYVCSIMQYMVDLSD